MITATAATLSTALAAASPGDIIDLGGTTGSPNSLPARSFDPPVTIRNGTLNGLVSSNAAGLTFSGVTFNATEGEFRPIRFTGCQRLRFPDCTFRSPGTVPVDTIVPTLLYLKSCTDVVVSNSDLSRGQFAIHTVDCDNVTVSFSLFHDIRSDGVQATGARGLNILGNVFRDFYGAGEIGTTGDHSDRIQVTSGGGSRSSANIVIRGNTMLIGAGRVSQGIYVADEGDVLGPPQGVTIEDNHVQSGMDNGIFVSDGTQVRINRNTVPSSGGASFLRVSDGVELIQLLSNAANMILPPGTTADPSNVAAPN